MAKKEKQEKTVKQQIKTYRIRQYSLFGGEFLTALAPYITIGAINFNDYFYQENGWKVGIGFTLSLAVMGFVVFAMSKGKLKDYGYRGSLVSIAICLFIVGVIAWLFASILNDLAMICFFGAVGVVGSFGLDIVSADQKKKADELQKAYDEYTKDTTKEQIKKESLKKRIEKEERAEAQATE